MKTFKSHKIVQAAKITSTEVTMPEINQLCQLIITLDDGTKKVLQPGAQRFAAAKVGDYFVVYDDGYESISPPKAFEEGYTEVVYVIPPEGAITHKFDEFKDLECILPSLLMSASGKRVDWFYLPPAERNKSDPLGMPGYIGYKEIAPNAERIYAGIAAHTPALIQVQAKIDALASDIGAKHLAAYEARAAKPLKDDSALYGGAELASGPKVTMQDITDSIASEHYFRAIDGVAGAAHHIGDRNFSGSSQNPLNLLTFCVLELKNGYTVTGKSACVSAENFDADLGRKYAYEDAIEQCWPLLGFALKDRLYRRKKSLVKIFKVAGADPSFEKMDRIARVCHEVNRAYCEALGDRSQPSWHDAPEWQRSSARMGVDLHTMGDFGPEASHISWMQQKLDEGWKYGPVKNPEAKEHPCIVPFAELPREQQAKDFIFRAVVHALR